MYPGPKVAFPIYLLFWNKRTYCVLHAYDSVINSMTGIALYTCMNFLFWITCFAINFCSIEFLLLCAQYFCSCYILHLESLSSSARFLYLHETVFLPFVGNIEHVLSTHISKLLQEFHGCANGGWLILEC